MHKLVETFHANKGYKLAIAIFISTSTFQNRKFVYFSNVIYMKTRIFEYDLESV